MSLSINGMSVDIFMEMEFCAPAFGQVPKIEPVVPNLMFLSSGSRLLASTGEAAAKAAVETMKWRRLSMAAPLVLLGRSLSGRGMRCYCAVFGKNRVIPPGVAA